MLVPYGTRPYRLSLPRGATVLDPPTPPPARSTRALLEEALDHPIGLPGLEALATRRGRVVIIVSDDTRDDPRRDLVAAALARLPAEARVSIAIASGTHEPCDPRALGLGDDLLARVDLIRHDSRDRSCLEWLGTTARGTPVRVHRRLLEADLVVATGQIKPHYFAGFGAGAKAIFPGLGGEREIRKNHALKREPLARGGEIDRNPCRQDIEEAVGMLPTPAFLLNAVADATGGTQDAVAGELKRAFHEGSRRCAPHFRVRGRRSQLVVVSDELPVTGSLYQASKLVASIAPLVTDGGTVVLVAQCPRGTGPVETVNRGIYEIGLAPRLPSSHRIVLVSDLDRQTVETTYCEYAERVEDVLEKEGAVPTVVPRAGSLIVHPEGDVL